MGRKLVVVLLALSASGFWAQSSPATQNSTRTSLHLSGYDDKIPQPASAQAPNQNSPSSAQRSVQYTFTSFQFPGATTTVALGINNHGQIAGAYAIAPGPRHALLIENGQLTPLDPVVLGRHFSSAFDINERGDVVGSYVDDQFAQHGFLFSNNALTNIDFPGGFATDAFGINDSGVIVGDFFDAVGAVHGFVLRDGVYTQIDVPGAVDTQPVKINASGDIVGAWDTDINTRGHGFLLTREGEFIVIDEPNSGPQSTSAIGLNDRGQIVGAYEDAAGTTHGFLLVGGTFRDIDFPGADRTNCQGITNSGQIVGAYVVGSIRSAYMATPVHP